MVIKLPWRPWPPVPTQRFKVKLTVHSLEGMLNLMACKKGELGTHSAAPDTIDQDVKVMVAVKWKGPKGSPLQLRLKRDGKRARTAEKLAHGGSSIYWEEEFEHICALTVGKHGHRLPWSVCFVISQVGAKAKPVVLGMGKMDLSESIATAVNARHSAKVLLSSVDGVQTQAALAISIDASELQTRESAAFSPVLPCMSGPSLCDLDDVKLGHEGGQSCTGESMNSAITFKSSGELDIAYVDDISLKSNQSSESSRNSFESDSVDESEEESAVNRELHPIHSYGPLAGVNLLVEGALLQLKENRQVKEEVASNHSEAATKPLNYLATTDAAAAQSSMHSILSWRKRKLSFRSPHRSPHRRGQPLLNKDYGEDGGDDIDFDRRRLTGSPLDALRDDNSSSFPLDFGEECFAVGNWERKDLVSRDGKMQLSANVFFATIDQRSGRAGGESACTALVAVIANWLHQNPDRTPIKAELDTLIREGSAEWRKLSDNAIYKERFPDKHFDLDTILQAQVRPLIEAPVRSFVGFFQPEGIDDTCNFLQGAMSFDKIWDEIMKQSMEDESFGPAIYIVSWNDHFFVLKVEREACYIIDTLGERLYEGCNQAYMLCFNDETILSSVPSCEAVSDPEVVTPEMAESERVSASVSPPHKACTTLAFGPSSRTTLVFSPTRSLKSTKVALSSLSASASCTVNDKTDNGGMSEVKEEQPSMYKGKDACKHFIKSFFAALPLRELEQDIMKGQLGSISLHQRLQIEFHFTCLGPKAPIAGKEGHAM